MTVTYTVKQASELTGASKQAVRLYTQRYQLYLSTEATPEHGDERRFTESDLKLIAFIYHWTHNGQNHKQVEERLARGELEEYSWNAPEAPGASESYIDVQSTMIELKRTSEALQAVVEARTDERDRAILQNEELLTEIRELRQALGKAEGRQEVLQEMLAKLEASGTKKRPQWWVTLFGE